MRDQWDWRYFQAHVSLWIGFKILDFFPKSCGKPWKSFKLGWGIHCGEIRAPTMCQAWCLSFVPSYGTPAPALKGKADAPHYRRKLSLRDAKQLRPGRQHAQQVNGEVAL